MRIYLAAVLNSGWGTLARDGNTPSNQRFFDTGASYPHLLESYHYLKDNRQGLSALRQKGKTLFLDSGAFSMFTKGVAVDLGAYAEFVKTNRDALHTVSNLDVIGRDNEQGSYDNQKALERMGLDVCPVHHARDADKWLERYIAEGYDYIFLGGMVPETTAYLREWLDHIFSRYLTRRDGTARIKVHGFGLTTLELMQRYPWYSVDSTSWVMTASFGGVFLDLPHRDIKVTFSENAPARRKLDAHFDTLDPITRRMVENRVREVGFDVADLRGHYAWRYAFNIEFYRRMLDRPDPVFMRRDCTLF